MSNPWRRHPKLAGRFLPDFPDDLQILAHDGGPRLTPHRPEAVWVTVTSMSRSTPPLNGGDECASSPVDVFRGKLLNQPHELASVRRGDEVAFVVADGAELPVMVTDKYLRERPAWEVHPCRMCGFAELFDAPSDLVRAVFPDTPADETVSMFTALCPLCHGFQLVKSRGNPPPDGPPAARPPAARPWWKFWG